MAPTYKDLAKTWLSNWLAGVRGAREQRVCVCAREKESSLAARAGVEGGTDRVQIVTRTMLHITRGPIPSREFANSRGTPRGETPSSSAFRGRCVANSIMKIAYI